MAAVGSVLGFVVLWETLRLLGLSQDFECVSCLDLRNTGPDCLGEACVVGPFGVCGVEEDLVKGEEEFPGTHLLGSTLFRGSFGNSLAQFGGRWSDLRWRVLQSWWCLVQSRAIPLRRMSRVQIPGSRLGPDKPRPRSVGLDRWSLISFSSKMSRTRQSLWTSGYVLPARYSGKLIRSEATASEVHHSRSFGTLPCSSFSGCKSVPTREARNAVRIFGNGDVESCEVSRNRGQGVVQWRHNGVRRRWDGVLKLLLNQGVSHRIALDVPRALNSCHALQGRGKFGCCCCHRRE